MSRKEIKKYFFSVEGETEELYLNWLEKKINSFERSKYNVKFDVKVEKNPKRRVKQINTLNKIDILHVIDYEEENNDPLFQKSLTYMREAEGLKKVKYHLGYSNYTFDLWIILHKNPYFSTVSHRKNYLSVINRTYNCGYESMDEYKEKRNFNKILEQLSLQDVINAIERAETIERNNNQNGYRKVSYRNYSYFKNNPSLNLHEYIKKIFDEIKIY